MIYTIRLGSYSGRTKSYRHKLKVRKTYTAEKNRLWRISNTLYTLIPVFHIGKKRLDIVKIFCCHGDVAAYYYRLWLTVNGILFEMFFFKPFSFRIYKIHAVKHNRRVKYFFCLCSQFLNHYFKMLQMLTLFAC